MHLRKTLARRSLITALLTLLVLIQGVRMAHRHWSDRKDFSQDQLFAISQGTKNILGRIEDRLQVKAYFTGEVRSGELSLIKARVEAQMKEFERLSGGSIGLTVQDPSILSTAAEEARSYGIDPLPVVTTRSGEQNSQLVYLGAVLRYRSRTEVLPVLNPWSFEVDFAGAVQRLLRDQRLRVGICGDGFDAPEPEQDKRADPFQGGFQRIRASLARRMELVEVDSAGLEAGLAIPADLDLLVVLRPLRWHPRAAFALDQYVQKGGRALILLDQVTSSGRGPAAHLQAREELPATGLEPLLASWGTPLVNQHIWDRDWAGMRAKLVWDLDDQGQPTDKARLDPLKDPACPMIRPEGFERTFQATARSSQVQFFWPQALAPADAPQGVQRLDLIRSSQGAFAVDFVLDTETTQDRIESMTRSLLAGEKGQSFVLAAVLTGDFPSPFAKGAPKPFDPLTDERGRSAGTTDEEVLDGDEESSVVVVADTDWLRDPLPGSFGPLMPSGTPENLRLFDNLIDWLTQEEDLIAVRSKEPRNRPLVNFLEEELRAEGLSEAEAARTPSEMRDRLDRRDRAEARAGRARLKAMLLPLALTLALVFLLAGLWNWKERRAS